MSIFHEHSKCISLSFSAQTPLWITLFLVPGEEVGFLNLVCPRPPSISIIQLMQSVAETFRLLPAKGVLRTARGEIDPGHLGGLRTDLHSLSLPGEQFLPLLVLGKNCDCGGNCRAWEAEAEEL